MEVAPEKIGAPVSLSRGGKNDAAMVSSVQSVSHRDDHTWTLSEGKVHYGGEN